MNGRLIAIAVLNMAWNKTEAYHRCRERGGWDRPETDTKVG